MITGKDLIEMNFKPNKLFKSALLFINDNNLKRDEIFKYMESIQPKYIDLRYNNKRKPWTLVLG